MKMPDALPLEQACLLACGFSTGAGAALWATPVQPGSSVAVIGCGGVGLAVVQGARLAGAATIVAVDVAAGEARARAASSARRTRSTRRRRRRRRGARAHRRRRLRVLGDHAAVGPRRCGAHVRVRRHRDARRRAAAGPHARRRPRARPLRAEGRRSRSRTAATRSRSRTSRSSRRRRSTAGSTSHRFVTKTIALEEVPDALEELHAPTGIRTVVRSLAASSCRTRRGARRRLGVDEVPVALDVAALAADDEDDRVLVDGFEMLARRRRARVEEPARARGRASRPRPRRGPCRGGRSTARPACRGSAGSPRSRADRRARSRRTPSTPSGGPDLPEAVAVAELVERGERVAHSLHASVCERQAAEQLGERSPAPRR